MKKLIVLTLVLGIVSLASAGYVVSYASDTVTVSGVGVLGIGHGVGVDDKTDGFGLIPQTSASYTVDPTLDGVITAAPVFDIYDGATLAPYDGGIVVLTWGDVVTVPYDDGPWFTFGLAGYLLGTSGSHDLQLDIVNASGETGDGNTIYLSEIPEPATMALLGLGALLLRRKK